MSVAKASVATRNMLVGNEDTASELHPANALLSISRTPSANVTELSAEQPEKAHAGIVVWHEISAFLSAVMPVKAYVSIVWTSVGITSLVMPLFFANALDFTVRTNVGIVNSPDQVYGTATSVFPSLEYSTLFTERYVFCPSAHL